MLLSNLEAEIDVKDYIARFTTDVISSCAFGLETNALANPNNEMRKLFTGESNQVSIIKEYLITFLRAVGVLSRPK